MASATAPIPATATSTAVPAGTTTTGTRRTKRARGESSTGTVLEYFIAIFLPPLAVFLVDGCSSAFLINIALTILGWIPGALHALWSVAQKDPASKVKTRERDL